MNANTMVATLTEQFLARMKGVGELGRIGDDLIEAGDIFVDNESSSDREIGPC